MIFGIAVLAKVGDAVEWRRVGWWNSGVDANAPELYVNAEAAVKAVKEIWDGFFIRNMNLAPVPFVAALHGDEPIFCAHRRGPHNIGYELTQADYDAGVLFSLPAWYAEWMIDVGLGTWWNIPCTNPVDETWERPGQTLLEVDAT